MSAAPYPALGGAGARRLLESDARIVVVGAGGWLGMATLELLHGLFGADFARRVVAFGSNARTLELRGGVRVAQRPLTSLDRLAPAPSLVLHLAFLTQEKARAMGEADYVSSNRAISGAVLTALDRIGAEAVFVASSGAAAMASDPAAEASKRLYGALKLKDEAAFGAWAEANGGTAAIARVFNLSGPYINKRTSYALACFIDDALAGRRISIRSGRPTWRSYVAIEEMMGVVFGVLTAGAAETVRFDTAGDAVYEMADIAGIVREVLGPGLAIDRPALTNEQPDRYVGDAASYRKLRRRINVEPVGFANQVRRTARFMAARGEA
ncbi:MAG: NAD-dependent epimerase/dehydratase family protein [Caulobacteraceae bacterium]